METQQPPSLQLPNETVALLRRHNMLLPLLRHNFTDNCVSGIGISDEERARLLQSYCQRHKLEGDDALASNIQKRGLTQADLIWQLELPIRKARFALERFGAKAEQRFLERKNNLDQVVYSLLRLEDGFLAQELYLQIAEGESNFADLAAQHSEGSEKATRGVVGPVALDRAHPVLVDKLRSSSVGSLLEPFKIQQWWLVVRLEQYQPAQFDQAMAQQMSNELFEEWISEELAPNVARFMSSDTSTPAA